MGWGERQALQVGVRGDSRSPLALQEGPARSLLCVPPRVPAGSSHVHNRA